MGRYIDYDKYYAEREHETTTVRIFGRDCEVPVELPFDYMMKLIKLSQEEKGASTSENLKLLSQMFKPDDYKHITTNPKFKVSDVHALVRVVWLETPDDDDGEAEEVTEDSLIIEKSGAHQRKKA